MATGPPTCDVCGTLITERRGGELIRKSCSGELVWVHQGCRPVNAMAVYVPRDHARFAFLSLDDPAAADNQGWVELADVSSQRGRWEGSDGADFETGLGELVEEGWIERHDERAAFRMTAKGSILRPRLDL